MFHKMFFIPFDSFAPIQEIHSFFFSKCFSASSVCCCCPFLGTTGLITYNHLAVLKSTTWSWYVYSALELRSKRSPPKRKQTNLGSVERISFAPKWVWVSGKWGLERGEICTPWTFGPRKGIKIRFDKSHVKKIRNCRICAKVLSAFASSPFKKTQKQERTQRHGRWQYYPLGDR